MIGFFENWGVYRGGLLEMRGFMKMQGGMDNAKTRSFLKSGEFLLKKKGGRVFRGLWRKIGVFVEKWWVFWKNGIFVGFWSGNWEKVGKNREFDDFLKIGKNREK